MASLQQHLETLRQKPHHVRHQIAYGVAGGVTALVALVWVTTMATSGSFALKSNEGAPDAGSEVTKALATSKTTFTELMGAAGAAFGATSTDPAISVVEIQTTSTFDTKIENDTDKTVIPF